VTETWMEGRRMFSIVEKEEKEESRIAEGILNGMLGGINEVLRLIFGDKDFRLFST